ncbi:SURF1 family protein [Rhodovibrionaceae bacterium A322]
MPAFRPKPLSTIFTLVCLVIMLGLGTWQLDRLAWKEGLLADLERRASEDPLPFPASVLSQAPEQEGLFQRFAVSGRYLNDQEFFLAAKTHKGKSGFHLVTPFQLDSGPLVLVDRGWVPPEKKDRASRPESLKEGLVEEVLALRVGGWTGYDWIKPVNDAQNNLWIFVDPPAMAQAIGNGDLVTTVYFQAERAVGAGESLPIARETVIDLPNNHLEYALTWYALALILLIFYLAFTFATSRSDTVSKD